MSTSQRVFLTISTLACALLATVSAIVLAGPLMNASSPGIAYLVSAIGLALGLAGSIQGIVTWRRAGATGQAV